MDWCEGDKKLKIFKNIFQIMFKIEKQNYFELFLCRMKCRYGFVDLNRKKSIYLKKLKKKTHIEINKPEKDEKKTEYKKEKQKMSDEELKKT